MAIATGIPPNELADTDPEIFKHMYDLLKKRKRRRGG